jgi:hypothetical protein
VHLHPLHSSVSFPFPFPLEHSSRQSPFTFMSYYYFCYHHHHFRSRFHRWARTCAICPFEFGLSRSTW